MKLLFAIRNDYLTNLGGDSIQLLKTKEHLEREYNLKIKIITDSSELNIYPDFKIIHIFNLQTIDLTHKFILESRKHEKKILLSPIYWNLLPAKLVTLYFNITGTMHGIKCLKSIEKIYRIIMKLIPFKRFYLSKNYIKMAKQIIEMCDMLLPNSPEELKLISNDFNIDIDQLLEKSIVVPNAFDIDYNEKKIKLPINIKDFVLVVGRIEPIKNQLGVLKALQDKSEIPIIFVGRATNLKYFKKIKKMAEKRGNVYFVGEIEHKMIYAFYKNALVHVLPSFRESPGLSSLEAISCGCPIVVSSEKYCPVNYYGFDKNAEICDPYDINSIRSAIAKAIEKNFKNKIKINLSYFTYSNSVKITMEAYKKLIKSD